MDREFSEQNSGGIEGITSTSSTNPDHTSTRTPKTRNRKTKTENQPILEPLQIAVPQISTSLEKPKTKKAAKEAEIMALEDNLVLIGKMGFDLVAGVAGPLWQVEQAEVQNIASPAARILHRQGAAAVTNKYTDYFMLTAALALTIVPRIIMQVQANKRALQAVRGGVKVERQTTADDRPVNTEDRADRSDLPENSISNLKNLMPAVG